MSRGHVDVVEKEHEESRVILPSPSLEEREGVRLDSCSQKFSMGMSHLHNKGINMYFTLDCLPRLFVYHAAFQDGISLREGLFTVHDLIKDNVCLWPRTTKIICPSREILFAIQNYKDNISTTF